MATRGMYVGLAPLGTALTADQARQLAQAALPRNRRHRRADQALAPAVQVLATADPSSWDRTCAEIADRFGTDVDNTRRALHQAVRAWHDDLDGAAAQQLDTSREVRARLEAAARQTPEQRWAPIADQLDSRLTAQEDWPALAHVMQHLHDEGHDVETLARTSITSEPLGVLLPDAGSALPPRGARTTPAGHHLAIGRDDLRRRRPSRSRTTVTHGHRPPTIAPGR